jgi:LDH2 family malate/lactate/ureidoglycolate dehydrogenase
LRILVLSCRRELPRFSSAFIGGKISLSVQSKLLDADAPDTVRMTPAQAVDVGMRALRRIGFNDEDAKIIVDQLVDNALCGYRFASLPRILAIAGDAKTGKERKPIAVVHETPLSAMIDGGNNVGYVSVYRGAQLAIEKAQKSGFCAIGVYNTYYSGRNAYYVEMIAKEGLVAIHVAGTYPHVLPIGGRKPALGTNPFCVGFPSSNGPVVYDIGTASLMWGEVLLHAHLGRELPEGIGFDADGNPTRDAKAVIDGGVVPFGEHKGYGLSFIAQAFGVLAGAALARGQVQDYGFLLLVLDPKLLLPGGDFPAQMSELVAKIKATPRRPGVEEIRVPSERAFRERERRRVEGLVFDRKVIESLEALGLRTED